MEKIKYERNWCEHFTKCPYFFEEERDEPYVGDYYCSRCRYFASSQEDKKSSFDELDYEKYFVNITGVVYCKFDSRYHETF